MSSDSVADLKSDALNFHREPRPGKLEISATKPLANQRDLALAYSPGVAFACEAIVADPHEADNLTIRQNLVAVLTNGTAVLGLGAIGPLASKPVMEGKAVLFKRFADIDVFDIELATSDPETGIDLYMGSGGAPEGVLAAAALRCIGGQMQGKLLFENQEQIDRARTMGITDPNRIYTITEMAKGDVMFAATGVTSGPMLRGVHRAGNSAVTHSIVMRSKSGTVRYVEAHHNFAKKKNLAE